MHYHLIALYSTCSLFLLYLTEYTEFINTNQFTPYLIVSLSFYLLLLFLNIADHRRTQNRDMLVLSKYINIVSLIMTFASFLIRSAHTSITLKYVTWFFTFPVILRMDFKTVDTKNVKWHYLISVGASWLMIFFTLLHHITDHYVLDKYIILSSIIHLYSSNSNNRFRYNTFPYVNIINYAYGMVYTLSRLNLISGNQLYISYIFLDVSSKSLFTMLYQVSHIKHINHHSYGILKTIRIIMPHIHKAFMSHIIDAKEYRSLVEHIDISTPDLQSPSLQTQLIKELYPNDAWQQILTPYNQYKIHENIVILFCDLVNYSAFCKENELDEVVRFMNDYYSRMDNIVMSNNVQKVETIGDAYLIVSESVGAVIECAKAIIEEFKEHVRIGIHCGKAASCTLGIVKLRHAYVGNTVNMAARLESSGVPGKIHVSEDVVKLAAMIAATENYTFDPRNDDQSEILLKGIGNYRTYFLTR